MPHLSNNNFSNKTIVDVKKVIQDCPASVRNLDYDRATVWKGIYKLNSQDNLLGRSWKTSWTSSQSKCNSCPSNYSLCTTPPHIKFSVINNMGENIILPTVRL